MLGHRDYGFAYEQDTRGNVYTHNIENGAGAWNRGQYPDLGYGFTFAMSSPRWMREPGTNLGSYNFARL